MAAGLPVVAADWNGYREIIVPDETGYLVQTMMPLYPPGFEVLRHGSTQGADLLAATTSVDVSILTTIILKLSEDKQKRAEMGLAARKRARKTYDWKVIIQQYEELWAELSDSSSRKQSSRYPHRCSIWMIMTINSVFGNYPVNKNYVHNTFCPYGVGTFMCHVPGWLDAYCGGSSMSTLCLKSKATSSRKPGCASRTVSPCKRSAPTSVSPPASDGQSRRPQT